MKRNFDYNVENDETAGEIDVVKDPQLQGCSFSQYSVACKTLRHEKNKTIAETRLRKVWNETAPKKYSNSENSNEKCKSDGEKLGIW